MTIIKNIIVLGIWSILCLSIGFIYGSKEPKIKIVKETTTKFKYIRIVTKPKDLKECYKSKLNIDIGLLKDNWVEIKTHDDCKEASKKIKISTKAYKNSFMINTEFRSIKIFYYRHFNTYSIGTGISYPFSIHMSIGYNF